MKNVLMFLVLLCSYILCGAQATSLTVDNKVAGTLSQRILYDDKLTVQNLTISGEINADDLEFIDDLNSHHKLTGVIDLSNTTVVAGGRRLAGNSYISTINNTLNVRIFRTSYPINKFIAPSSITSWDDGDYSQSNGSTGTSTVYPNLNTDSLVLDCPKLKVIDNGIGTPSYLFVGEGVQSLSIASKYLGRLPGASDDHYLTAPDSMCIFLPKTLISFYGNTRMGVPKMRIYSKIPRPDQLTTNSTKWYNDVLVNGIIYAPNDTKQYYQSSIFKNLDIVAPISVKSVSVSPKSISLKVGEHKTVSALVLPTNADDPSISWHSTDTSVATVTENGTEFGVCTVSAVGPGSAKIYATSNFNPEINSFCEVSVIQPATGISLDKSAVEMVEDESIRIKATVLPIDASNQTVTWTSSDISIAMVSPDGTVYAIKPGQATIMATAVDGGYVALCKVTVKPKTTVATALKLSTYSETISVGETLQLSAILSPDNVTNKNISWTSTDASVATVDASGLVRALSDGKTQIIATTTDGSNLSAICEITVEKQFIAISQLELNPSNARITIGTTITLTTVITPENASSKEISWSSTNPSVATVSQSGAVTAISEGEAIIIASTKDGSNLSATCKITAYPEIVLVREINLNPTTIDGKVNDLYEINATVLPENATNKVLNWESSNDDIATINNGTLRLLKIGTATITATATDGSNISSDCTIVVSDNAGAGCVIEDQNTLVRIFDLNGYLIYDGKFSDAKLASGFYIILYNGKSYKTKID